MSVVMLNQVTANRLNLTNTQSSSCWLSSRLQDWTLLLSTVEADEKVQHFRTLPSSSRSHRVHQNQHFHQNSSFLSAAGSSTRPRVWSRPTDTNIKSTHLTWRESFSTQVFRIKVRTRCVMTTSCLSLQVSGWLTALMTSGWNKVSSSCSLWWIISFWARWKWFLLISAPTDTNWRDTMWTTHPLNRCLLLHTVHLASPVWRLMPEVSLESLVL